MPARTILPGRQTSSENASGPSLRHPPRTDKAPHDTPETDKAPHDTPETDKAPHDTPETDKARMTVPRDRHLTRENVC